MRLTRFDELSLAQRELFRVRVKRSTRAAVIMGVGMGLAYTRDGFMGLAQAGDPWWRPIVMGVANGTMMFAMHFFAVGRFRALYKNDEQLIELEELAREEKDSQVSG